MQLTEKNLGWSQKLLKKYPLVSGRPGFSDSPQQLACPTAGGTRSQPTKGERQGAAPKKRAERKCLLIVTCGIGEIPQWELPVKLYQRVKQQTPKRGAPWEK